MSTRISSLASLALLAACGQAAPAPGEAIACAIGGASEFTADCGLERKAVEGGQLLVVRHPDGEFHRLELGGDGQNLIAADGAEATQSALKGDRWEVILGEHRYVIPVKAVAPRE